MNTITQKVQRKLYKLFLFILVFITINIVVTTLFIQFSGDDDFTYNQNNNLIINDVTQLNPIKVAKVITPKSEDDISKAIKESQGPISIGGGRFSMGGQVAYEQSLHLDMRQFNKIISLNHKEKILSVQSGATWRDIQEAIDPHNLSVKIMQTYANFTVGGSLSVNAHGRYIGEGPIVQSVESIKIILANGELITASRDINADIFYGAIGGFGGIGVITEATLRLSDNHKIERKTQIVSVEDYVKHFNESTYNNPDVVFQNGDLYPPHYNSIMDVSWIKTDKDLTINDRLRDKDAEYKWTPAIAEFVANYDSGKWIRQHVIDPILYSKDMVVWRNWEASYDVKELEPEDREDSTYVLREYFVPMDKFDEFVPKMKDIFVRLDVNIINVSIRHATRSPKTLLSWAREDVFAFVVYYQQGTDNDAKEAVKSWSIEMIDAAISVGGTYYLPYQIFANAEQFHQAYPHAQSYFELKSKVDPENRFTNQLWKHHYPALEKTQNIQKAEIKNYYRGEEQTVLTIPEWYLVFNPKEQSEFLASGKNPSDFPYLKSIDEYWSLYDRCVEISNNYPVDNSQYMTMLKVIGISTTLEYLYKSAYENTLGRFTRWLADDKDTPEDKIIASAQKAYSELIYNEAWYMFDFSAWIKKIWVDPNFFGPNFIRKLERKFFFTLEYGFKTGYAALIGFTSKTAYGESDGLIYLTASMSEEQSNQLPENTKIHSNHENEYILSIPRWGPFTETLPKLLALGVTIADISGNHKIAVTYLTPKSKNISSIKYEKLFDSRVVTDQEITRRAAVVDIASLDNFLNQVKSQEFTLEHIYDY